MIDIDFLLAWVHPLTAEITLAVLRLPHRCAIFLDPASVGVSKPLSRLALAPMSALVLAYPIAVLCPALAA